ncbi:MAG: hypothetical protein ABEI98_01560 [Halorhabdus sp.]
MTHTNTKLRGIVHSTVMLALAVIVTTLFAVPAYGFIDGQVTDAAIMLGAIGVVIALGAGLGYYQHGIEEALGFASHIVSILTIASIVGTVVAFDVGPIVHWVAFVLSAGPILFLLETGTDAIGLAREVRDYAG